MAIPMSHPVVFQVDTHSKRYLNIAQIQMVDSKLMYKFNTGKRDAQAFCWASYEECAMCNVKRKFLPHWY